jgi:hypothetical protein
MFIDVEIVEALSHYFSVKKAIANLHKYGTNLGYVVGYDFDAFKFSEESRLLLKALGDLFESSQFDHPLMIRGSVLLLKDEKFVFTSGGSGKKYEVSLKHFPVQVTFISFSI